MKRKLVKTKDHSSTLFVPELDEHYHSIHGALQESLHVFIKAGLHHLLPAKELSILEVGLGTGLNALLTALEIENSIVRYTALEKYPVSSDEWAQLNYAAQLNNKKAQLLLNQIHEAPWESWQKLTPNFQIFKHQVDLREYSSENEFDLIYFDAFAPSAQPDLWNATIFESMFRSLKPGGILVTYCVKGEVRRNMQAAGFEVEKIPGPPGKREMARAFKPDE